MGLEILSLNGDNEFFEFYGSFDGGKDGASHGHIFGM